MGTLSDRRRAMMVPYDARIEYLESTGVQYIDTLVNDVGITWHITAQATATPSSNTILIGSSSESYNWIGVSASQGNVWAAGSKAGQYTNKSSTQKSYLIITFQNDSASVIVDGSTGSIQGQHITGNYCLFCAKNSQGTPSYHIKARVWSVKCYVGGSLKRSLIPVRVGRVGYLYDKVSGQLYGNAGTGNFVLGPDV